LATNPILEVFGNAKTARLFDDEHEIVGACIRTYLLERSRLVYQPESERNYHIFYRLRAGALTKEKKDLGLFYLNQGGTNAITISGVNDGGVGVRRYSERFVDCRC
jgi:myosin-5